MRSELESYRSRLAEAERLGAESAAAAALAEQRGEEAREQLRAANSQLQIMRVSIVNSACLLAKSSASCILVFFLISLSEIFNSSESFFYILYVY